MKKDTFKPEPLKKIIRMIFTRTSFTLVICLTLIVTSQFCSASDHNITAEEYSLKAVCLYNFTQFSKWPSTQNLNEEESIVIGIVGESPFGSALEELQAQLTRKKRRNITIINHGPYQEGMDLTKSHLLYIGSSEKNKMNQIIASLEKAPVLTVSDADDFMEAGGMISLVLINNKVRWEINQTAIKFADIHVSAKLLQLAIDVRNYPGQSNLLPGMEEEHIYLSFFDYPSLFPPRLSS